MRKNQSKSATKKKLEHHQHQMKSLKQQGTKQKTKIQEGLQEGLQEGKEG